MEHRLCIQRHPISGQFLRSGNTFPTGFFTGQDFPWSPPTTACMWPWASRCPRCPTRPFTPSSSCTTATWIASTRNMCRWRRPKNVCLGSLFPELFCWNQRLVDFFGVDRPSGENVCFFPPKNRCQNLRANWSSNVFPMILPESPLPFWQSQAIEKWSSKGAGVRSATTQPGRAGRKQPISGAVGTLPTER